LFAWIFAGAGVVLSLCTFLNAQLASRFGARRSIRGLLTTYTIIAGLLLLATLVLGDPPNMSLFFAFVALLTGINVAIEPNSSALALEPVGAMAGMAAAIYGTSFFVVGAIAGSFISHLLVSSVLPLVISFFVIGLITTGLAYADRRLQLLPASASGAPQQYPNSREMNNETR
jgi:DHA1 family bicyclomycin/chloramphenicol resistance-like MFS transporter